MTVITVSWTVGPGLPSGMAHVNLTCSLAPEAFHENTCHVSEATDKTVPTRSRMKASMVVHITGDVRHTF